MADFGPGLIAIEEALRLLALTENAARAMGMHEGDTVSQCGHRKAEVQWFHEAVAAGEFRKARAGLNGSVLNTYDFHGATLIEKPDRECGHTRLREAGTGCELCDVDWLLESDNVSSERGDEGPEAARGRMLGLRAEIVAKIQKRGVRR